ncbi:MAG: hypothetical protein BroJett011_69290 [Chloroflexota bacterium]|nr:MAG: hypothetical protein BroJett011_69290 [Chloroflexota bacterium]
MPSPKVNQSTIVHHTIAYRAETENTNPNAQVWEFNCPYCNYRASYTKLSPMVSSLTVLNQGNSLVRHWNSFASEEKEEMWLTPALRQQMENLLQDVNID